MINMLVSLKASSMLTKIYMTKNIEKQWYHKNKEIGLFESYTQNYKRNKINWLFLSYLHIWKYLYFENMLISTFNKFACIMHNPSLYKMDQIYKLDF
jgi:uncharacterized membrane protein YesL